MVKNTRAKKPITINSVILWGAITLLSVVSFITTFSGMHELMRGDGGDPVSSYGIPLALTLALQVFLVASVIAFTDGKSFARYAWLVLYVICLLVSVVFGYTYYYELLRTQKVENDSQERLVSLALDRVRPINLSLDNVAATAKKLAEHSAERFKAEDQPVNGSCEDTCKGGRGPCGKGPQYILRRADAKQFDEVNKTVSAEVAKIRQLVSSLEALRGQKYSQAAVRQANDLTQQIYAQLTLAGGPLSQAKDGIRERVGGKRNGQPVLACNDTTLSRLGVGMERALSAVLDARPPERIVVQSFEEKTDVVTRTSALAYAIPVYMYHTLFSSAETAKEYAKTKNIEGDDLIPMFFGLLVDILIFVAAVLRSMLMSNRLAMFSEAELQRVTSSAEPSDFQKVIGMLVYERAPKIPWLRFLPLMKTKYYFAAPQQINDHPISIHSRMVVARLNSRKDASLRADGLPLAQVRSQFGIELPRPLEQLGSKFAIYELSSQAYFSLMDFSQEPSYA